MRRKLLLAGTVWPLMFFAQTARAQPKQAPADKSVRVAILRFSFNSNATYTTGQMFIDAMQELGWNEGRNIVYDRVLVERDEARLRALVAELVTRAPALIHTITNIEARVAAAETRTIPIIFSTASEPVEDGLVRSLARPGGNVTGIANIGWELGGKRMQLLAEALPKTQRVGVLTYPKGLTYPRELKLITQAAGGHVKVIQATANSPQEIDAAFGLFTRNRVEALLLTHTLLFQNQRKSILALAAKQRIPVIGFRSEIADDGGLISYSALLSDQVRRSAQLADKVLRGSSPATIPVEMPTKFELVVNLKIAKDLGIALPKPLLARADRVIE